MSLKENMARWIYVCVLFFALPFYVLKLWFRGRKEPEYSKRISERFGFYGYKAPYQGEYIWVHAVSLGEARASRVLIEHLRKQIPQMKLLLTHGTATGWEQGKELLQEGDVQCWMPVDIPGVVKRFIRHFQPRIGLLVETEMWPNVMHVASRYKLPVLLVNARLSERSLSRALKAGVLMRPAYRTLIAALAQSEDDAQRLQKMGTPLVEVVGNIKYDMLPDPVLLARGQQCKELVTRQVIMAASTREGEEELLLQAWQKMVWAKPGTNTAVVDKPVLLLVPRHPQRFDDVGKLISSMGFSMSRRSTWGVSAPGASLDAQTLNADVWLGDSLREMVMYYALSDIVLLGGSFKKYGGQNLIEALGCGRPVIFGKYTYNFARPSQMALEAGVGSCASSMDDALQQANNWLQDPQKLGQLQKDSIKFIQGQQGGAEKIAVYVAKYVKC